MSHRKLAGLLVVPLQWLQSVAGRVCFPSSRQTPQPNQAAAVIKLIPGDQPDKPGQAILKISKDKNGQNTTETND